MSDARLLVDTDMFVLLAGAGVLERVAELLNFTPDDLRRLHAVPFQLERSKKFQDRYSDRIRGEAKQAAKKIQPLTSRPDNEALLDRLAAIPEIDEGDAYLLARLAEQKNWLLTTGDKRAMIACATNPTARAVRKAVAGRVVCLETVIKLLVTHDGVEKTAAAFRHLRDANTTLRVIFSEANSTSRERCLQGVESYLRSLVRQVGEDFLYTP